MCVLYPFATNGPITIHSLSHAETGHYHQNGTNGNDRSQKVAASLPISSIISTSQTEEIEPFPIAASGLDFDTFD